MWAEEVCHVTHVNWTCHICESVLSHMSRIIQMYYMYVYIYIYQHVYMHIHTDILSDNTFICVHTCMYVHIYIYLYMIYMYMTYLYAHDLHDTGSCAFESWLWIHSFVCMYIRTHIICVYQIRVYTRNSYIYTYSYVHTYLIYIYMCIHVCIYRYTCIKYVYTYETHYKIGRTSPAVGSSIWLCIYVSMYVYTYAIYIYMCDISV